MFGYRYVKASPSTYVIQYKNGVAVREGTGLTFWYFAPSATLQQGPAVNNAYLQPRISNAGRAPLYRDVTVDFEREAPSIVGVLLGN